MYHVLIVLILGICYSFSIAPGLTWAHFSADGGDFISAAATGGVPHPSGYPLYMILARGFQFLPFGDLAFRTNLLSAFCTILTALLMYATIARQLRERPWARFAAFMAATAYGLAPFVWGQALVTEVYALHGLLMMLCIHVLGLEESQISEGLRGFVFGLAATNHLTSLMMFPLLALGSNGKLFPSRIILIKRCLGVAAGLSLYLSLPIRAYFDPPINWGDASTFGGFYWLISGQLYQKYLVGLSLADVGQRLFACVGLLLEQFTWFGAVFGIYGLLALPSRRLLISTLWMATVFLLFSVIYGSFDAQVNLLPVWLAFAIWLAVGLQELLFLLQERFKPKTLPVPGLPSPIPGPRSPIPALLSALLFAALMIRIPLLFPAVDASKDSRARDFIRYAEQLIPQNALVFVDGDAQIFSLWYAQFALHQRADMAIVVDGLLPYPWYPENLRHTYPNLSLPELVDLQTSDIMAANPDRPICTISPDKPIICR